METPSTPERPATRLKTQDEKIAIIVERFSNRNLFIFISS